MAGSTLEALFEPRSVALFGASDKPDSVATLVLRNLIEAGFEGDIHLFNPRHKSIGGRRVRRSMARLKGQVDLALVATPAPTVPEIIAQCGKAGVRAAIIISAGFRETGKAGLALEREVLKQAREYGLRILGPNCLGVIRPEIGFNCTFGSGHALPGRLALVSQSGALCNAILDWAQTNSVGFSSVISTGISSDVGFGDILDFLVEDQGTDSIMLYIEGIRNARRFMSALRAAARVKPVVVMKTGRQQAAVRAAKAHVGVVAGSDEVFDAALRRAGVLRVGNFDDFFSAAATLDLGIRTVGNRVAIITNAGGLGVMAVDRAAELNLELARFTPATRARLDEGMPPAWSRGNPVDVLGDADPGRYQEAVMACMDDPNVDVVLTLLTPQALIVPRDFAERIAVIASGAAKPIFTCWMGGPAMESSHSLFRENKIPTFHSPEGAVEALAAVVAHGKNQKQLLQVPEPLTREAAPDVLAAQGIIEAARARRQDFLNPAEAKALLRGFHIPVVDGVLATDENEAALAARKLGYPVVVKIDSPDIIDKTEIGGVRVGLHNARAVRSAVRRIIRTVAREKPEARIAGVVVEPMWQGRYSRELMVNVVADPVFGPAISFGPSGLIGALVEPAAVALPPLNRFLARTLIEDTRTPKYLEASHKAPAADQRAVEDLLLRVSEIVCELPRIKEMHLNPVMADDSGVVVIDAHIALRRARSSSIAYDHMAIHPYPSKLVEEVTLSDGLEVTIRPIRPEDAVIERDFINGLSDESRYYRFMHALKSVTPAMLSRFTQIDYDREMALIAVIEGEGGEREIAAARYVTLLDGESCEFAIVVADEWQGRGLAQKMMKALIAGARRRGLTTMMGIVLRGNGAMLKLARRLGFSTESCPDAAGVVNIHLEL